MAAVAENLTVESHVGIIANMKAILIYRHRIDFDDGAILEAVVWRLEKPVTGCAHPFKYRLFYGFPGQRVIGYDNERPKGDHRHGESIEEAHDFESPEKLLADFFQDVEARRVK